MKKWEKFSKEELEKMCRESYSYADLADKIGYSRTGGSGKKAVEEMIYQLHLDNSHFKGQAWNKNNFDYSRFQKGKVIRNGAALKALTFLKGHKCEKCKNSFWNGEKIPLEIHHKDGDHLNNELDNLQLLCPNCHFLTDNYCGKNKKNRNISNEEFLKALQNTNSIREALISLGINYASKYYYEKAYELLNGPMVELSDTTSSNLVAEERES